MRALLTCAVLTVTILTVNAAPASAHPSQDAALVDSWFHRYLGRCADPGALSGYTRTLRHGAPAEVVEAEILGSHEYYHRAGCTPEGYVARLFRDVLGRRPYAEELNRYVYRVRVQGRQAVAMQILDQRAVAFAPAPVIVRPAPVVAPVVVMPNYRHGPVIVDPNPRPAVSIRFNLR